MTHSNTARALTLGAFFLTLTSGPALAQGSGDIVLHAKRATIISGAWGLVSDTTAAGGLRLANPDAGQPKVSTALAAPVNYFEIPFVPKAGVGYHLWIRSKAQNNAWTNDSVYVQFSGSVTSSGSAKYRIGTTSAAMYSLEEDSNRGLSGWGWQDNGYGLNVLGEPLYFDGSAQMVRVQAREDGISIDQIVLSPVTFATTAPGAGKNDTVILAESSGSTTTAPAPAPAPEPSPSTFVWGSLKNATASGAVLKKSAGCGSCPDAGGVSQQQLSSASFTIASGQSLVVGLGRDTSTNTGYAIDYSFSFPGGSSWTVREAGVYKTEGPFAASDVFKVAIEGTVVKYYRNSTLVYTSLTPVTTPLVLDATLVTSGASVTVVSTSGTSTTTTTAPPPPPPPSTTGTQLRVLQWNLHHGGFGTDGVYDTNRVATWIAYMNPDVIMLNEVEKYTGWGNQDQPEVYKNLLQQKTGKTWYYMFAQEYGEWNSNGKGNMILSTYPISYTNRYELIHNYDRTIGLATITVNARPITLMSTHLDPYDKALRLVQATEVTTWAAPQPENRIIAGDMNAWPDQTSIAHFNTLYYDSWAVAAANGAAVAFAGNTGETKNGRIDYIFYSKGSTNLLVKSSQVYDTRDTNGYMPSDHRPVLTTFEVK